MASEASVAEQTTDEKIGENKVIDHAKFVEEASVSKLKETAGGEVDKHEVEPENSGTSVTDSNEIIEDKMDEASAAEVKKKVEDDEASASGVPEDKKNDSAAADEAEENVVSKASGPEILENGRGDESVVEDVKVEAETGKISSPHDAKVEASVREPEEKSLTSAESLSEAVDKALVESSLTSVQESEQVGYEPEASEAVVEIVKITEESLDNSANPALSSENIDKSGAPLIAPSVTEPTPNATGIPEGESEQVKYESQVSELAVEIAKTTEESLDISATPVLASEIVTKSEEQPVALTVTEPEATGEPERESEQVGHEPEASDPEVETVKTTGESLDASVDQVLASETAATSQQHPEAITVTEPTPEIIGEPERHEPEVSDPAVETVKTTGESLDASGDPALAAVTAVTSEEYPKAITVTEPPPETIGEPERESEQVGHEPEISDLAVETAKTTGESLDASGNPPLASQTAATSEEHPKVNTVKVPIPEAIGEPERESEHVGHEPEISDLAIETAKTTGESLDSSADPTLASETAARSEEHPKAITVTEPEPETIVESERESDKVGHEPEASDPAVETVKATGESLDVSANPAPALEPVARSEEQPIALTVAEPTPDAIGELERESEQVDEPVSEPVVEIAKTIGESLPIFANPALASETATTSEEHPIAVTVTDPSPNAIGEVEKQNETYEANEVVEASKEQNILAVEVQAASGLLKDESVVETGSSASQALNTVLGDSAEVKGAEDVEGSHSVSESMEKGSDDVNDDECPVETNNDESAHSATESWGKEVTVDASLPNPSIAVGNTEAMDATSTTEAAQVVVIPEANVEEHKAEKHLEAELVKEQEKKTVETVSTLPATNKTGDQVQLEVTEASSKEDKPSEGADKAVVEQDLSVSDSTTKTADNMEKERASEVADKFAEEPKHENQNVKDDTARAQTSRDIDLGGQTDKTNTSNEEPVVKLEEAEKSDIANVESDETPVVKLEAAEKSDTGDWEKDETEEKKDETEKIDAQNLLESSRGSAVSKTELEVQKAETSGKPSKTLMSKVKHSIGKVKKAIIGKSPSSKTISVESKDELKVK